MSLAIPFRSFYLHSSSFSISKEVKIKIDRKKILTKQIVEFVVQNLEVSHIASLPPEIIEYKRLIDLSTDWKERELAK